jgi:hypothetical protein
MKCKDFEFEYIAAPEEIAGDACEHLQSCTVCQAFVEQQAAFEKQLAEVIRCDVPKGFRHSVRKYVVNHQPSFWTLPKSSLALVASLLMAVGVGSVYQTMTSQQGVPLDRLVVEHIEHDGIKSMRSSHHLSNAQFAKVAQQFGVKVEFSSDVSFAEKCPIGNSYGLHMVYQYKGQPITVIYMPELSPKTILPFNYAGLKGWIEPLKKGSIAVLGGTTAELPKAEFADQSIEWL